jgi:hypothetical protein
MKTNHLPSIRVSDNLRKETEKSASKAQENLSEYIRKAVEQRNKNEK